MEMDFYLHGDLVLYREFDGYEVGLYILNNNN